MSLKTLNQLNDILKNCSANLSEVTLSRCRLASTHINTMMFAIPTNTFQRLGKLTKLNLSENRINDKATAMIASYIISQNRSHLISLNLEQNFITLLGGLSVLEAVR